MLHTNLILALAASLPLGSSTGDLRADSLAARWDEAMPLGNATVGALVWRNGDNLRMSLDRTDLWDLRASDSLAGPDYSFEWVKEHIRNGNYEPVQEKFDWPYDLQAAPSKIPGGALEFSLAALGKPDGVRLSLKDAACEVTWPGGARLVTFVEADEPVGWFEFSGLPASVTPAIVPPVYQQHDSIKRSDDHAGASLERLGYPQGTITEGPGIITYHQPGYGDFSYDIATTWERDGSTLRGVWSVTSSLSSDKAADEVRQALARGIDKSFAAHKGYWDGFWKASSVTIPDTLLQWQYDNEMYKLGSAARHDSYPISLQAVWTADNGYLPPWKGDYHHDLNTQLSYWPVYAGNHLDEGLGYLNTLWNQRDVYRRYTRDYFGKPGMNVPGVCTLTGEPMGGWIQYSMSQACGAWLAQHFYKHWKFSADNDFLAARAYPFTREAAEFLEAQSEPGADGVRRFEFSSSPEMFDNSLKAWFKDMTNYDLALSRFLFGAAAEMADSLGLADDAARWRADLRQLPALDTDSLGCLTIAPGFPYKSSHRHFSHAMAIHPLGLLDVSHGPEEKAIIDATIQRLDSIGPDYWTGYSYAWLGNLKARALDGDGAAEALRIFARAFCLPNTFHANGDQTKSGLSRFTYRPFTLEGNFAFAAGIQEMLLQSHTGVINLFPAIPADWRDASFDSLRAEGGFLVSASLEGGKLADVRIFNERGGKATLSFRGHDVTVNVPAGKWTSVKF